MGVAAPRLTQGRPLRVAVPKGSTTSRAFEQHSTSSCWRKHLQLLENQEDFAGVKASLCLEQL